MKKIILKNGLRIIVRERKQSQTVTIGICVGFGENKAKDKHSGMAHFIEHMMFKGTKKRTARQISYDVEKLGGLQNAFTNPYRTYYFISIPTKHFDSGLDILSDMILNSIFNKKELERERKVILEEIRRKADNPARKVYDLIKPTLYKKHPIKRPVLGTFNTIKNISREDILSYYKNYYVPNNMIITIVGNIKSNYVIPKVKKKFQKLNKKIMPVYKPTIDKLLITNQKNILKKQVSQANIVLSYRFMTRKDKDWPVGEFISYLLGRGMGSRLLIEIREKRGLAYTASSYYESFLDYGYFLVFVGTAKKNIPLVKKIILKELTKLKTKKLSKKELKDIKSKIEGRILFSRETNSNIAVYLSFFELFDKAEAYDKHIDKIKAVTAEDIQRVARKYFKNKYAFAAIVPK